MNVGSFMVTLAKAIQDPYSSSTVDYTSLIVAVVETLDTELAKSAFEKVDQGNFVQAIISAMSEGFSSSRRKRAMSTTSIFKVMTTLIISINKEFHEVYTTTSSSSSILSVLKTSVTKVKETLASEYSSEETSVKLISSIIEAIETELGSDEKIKRASLYSAIATGTTNSISSTSSSSAVNWVKIMSSSITAVKSGYSKVTANKEKNCK